MQNPLIFLKVGQKVDHAARELATLCSVVFVLVAAVGHMVKTPLPQWKVSQVRKSSVLLRCP